MQGSLPNLDRRKMHINRANKQLWVRVYLVQSAASQCYVIQCMFGCIDQCIACWDSWLPGWEMDNVRNCGLKHNQTTPVSSAKQLWKNRKKPRRLQQPLLRQRQRHITTPSSSSCNDRLCNDRSFVAVCIAFCHNHCKMTVIL